MTSTNSSLKRIAKVSSDNAAIGFDLLSSLTYMSVLSIGNLPRDQVLEECGRQQSKTSVFFEFVHRLVKRLGMEYTQAFQLVSEKAKPDSIKSLLLRFSASISSGESEKEFIVQEAKAEGERYSNEYERSIENLRKWTDAYAAILISVTLIMVVSLVSSMMGSLAQSFVTIMAFAVFFITSVGLFIIYRSAPVEKVTFDRKEYTTKSRRLARRFLVTLVPLGLVLVVLFAPRFGMVGGFSIAFLIVGISLAPTGFLASRDSGRVTKLDSELPTFLRSLGNVAGATGFTITQALGKIDTKSMGSLKSYINPLNSRLSARLPVNDCWDRFRDETGSELVNRTTKMLVEGTELGGEADRVGQICSDYAQTVTGLRAKLYLASSTFAYLTFPMHATTTFILVFVLHIIIGFNNRLSSVDLGGASSSSQETLASGASAQASSVSDTNSAIGSIGIFQDQDLSGVTAIIILVVVVLTIANGLAPKFASGGSNLKIASYLSVMCLISGGILGVVPAMTAKIFSA